MTSRVLTANTFVSDGEGGVIHLKAGETPPKALLDRTWKDAAGNDVPVLGEHLFVTAAGDEPAEPVEVDEGPVRPAESASKAKWASYAEDLGVSHDEKATKDEIIAAVDKHEQGE